MNGSVLTTETTSILPKTHSQRYTSLAIILTNTTERL